MYGFGSPGGLVNYVTKKPTDEAVRSVELGYVSRGCCASTWTWAAGWARAARLAIG